MQLMLGQYQFSKAYNLVYSSYGNYQTKKSFILDFGIVATKFKMIWNVDKLV